MSDNNIKNIMDSVMDKLRAMVNADTIIGTPVVAGNSTIIPVSKLSYGLATGATEMPKDDKKGVIGGGAGVSISPIAFIAITGDNVKLLPLYSDVSAVERAIAMTPEMIEKIRDIFKNR